MSSELRKCSRPGCDERFSLNIRGGRNSGKALAGRKHTPHEGRRYCSETCRKLASKARKRTQVTIDKGVVLSTVTNAPNIIEKSITYREQKSGRAWLIVPVPEWPGMYRVQGPDGSFLTDMVNLSRAKDAARCLSGEYRQDGNG